jgi:chloride channel 3/4/5
MSHLYTPPRRSSRDPRRRNSPSHRPPALLIPSPSSDTPGDIEQLDGDLQSLAEQGYKDAYADWPPDAHGIGARKYDDLTAIDWIHEYTKERARIRALNSRPGLIGRIKVAMDVSQAWIVLFGTGVSVGILAAAIDIISDWLGDLKDGFCRSTFYLNRGFCCWGISGIMSL